MNVPYTYLIGWSAHSTFYYGVRYSGRCKPSDLWVTYFSSSKYVRDFRQKFGEPDVIEVRRVFDDAKKARDFETRVLRRIRAKSRSDFLNKTDSPCPKFVGRHSEETKAKMRASASHAPRPEEVRAKIAAGNRKPKSPEATAKMRRSLTGKKHTSIARENMRKSHLGRKHTEETREKIRLAASRGNSRHAKPCTYDGRRFECLSDAIAFAGTSKYFVKRHPSFAWLLDHDRYSSVVIESTPCIVPSSQA